MNPQNVLIAPILSEKASGLKATQNIYSFSVDKDATRIDVKRAVEKLWSVQVTSVQVLRTKAKVKTLRSKSGEGRTGTIKKAYVRLKQGQTIPELEV